MAPGPALAEEPSPFRSSVRVIKDTARASSPVGPDNEGVEFYVLLASGGGQPLTGAIYVASSRPGIDFFYYERADRQWEEVAGGKIEIADLAANLDSQPAGAVLGFNLKAVSSYVGSPDIAVGLDPKCITLFVSGGGFPDGCDLSHIIGQAAINVGGNADAEVVYLSVVDGKTEGLPADGAAAYRLSAQVMAGGTALSGREVSFSIAGGAGAALSASKAVTGRDGRAEAALAASRPGTFTVEARINDLLYGVDRIELTFGPPPAPPGNGSGDAAKPLLVFPVEAPYYIVDGARRDAIAPSFVRDNRVFLSIRDMGAALGAAIGWEDDTQTAVLSKDGLVLKARVGESHIELSRQGDVAGGESALRPVDSPAVNQDGRVYLPFRAVLEAFGYQVVFNPIYFEVNCS